MAEPIVLRHGDINRLKVTITLRNPISGVVVTDTATVDAELSTAKFWITGKTNLTAPDAAAELSLNSSDQAAQFDLHAAITGGTAVLYIELLPADLARLKPAARVSDFMVDVQMLPFGAVGPCTLLMQELTVLPEVTRATA